MPWFRDDAPLDEWVMDIRSILADNALKEVQAVAEPVAPLSPEVSDHFQDVHAFAAQQAFAGMGVPEQVYMKPSVEVKEEDAATLPVKSVNVKAMLEKMKADYPVQEIKDKDHPLLALKSDWEKPNANGDSFAPGVAMTSALGKHLLEHGEAFASVDPEGNLSLVDPAQVQQQLLSSKHSGATPVMATEDMIHNAEKSEAQLLNEAIFEKLTSKDPVAEQKAIDAVNDFTISKMKEEGFAKKILPPLNISNEELDKAVDALPPGSIVVQGGYEMEPTETNLDSFELFNADDKSKWDKKPAGLILPAEVEEEKQQLEFFAYEEVGGVVGHAAGIEKAEFDAGVTQQPPAEQPMLPGDAVEAGWMLLPLQKEPEKEPNQLDGVDYSEAQKWGVDDLDETTKKEVLKNPDITKQQAAFYEKALGISFDDQEKSGLELIAEDHFREGVEQRTKEMLGQEIDKFYVLHRGQNADGLVLGVAVVELKNGRVMPAYVYGGYVMLSPPEQALKEWDLPDKLQEWCYQHELERLKRLGNAYRSLVVACTRPQLRDILNVVCDGNPRSYLEIAEEAGHPVDSVSAQLRRLRRQEAGGFVFRKVSDDPARFVLGTPDGDSLKAWLDTISKEEHHGEIAASTG